MFLCAGGNGQGIQGDVGKHLPRCGTCAEPGKGKVMIREWREG